MFSRFALAALLGVSCLPAQDIPAHPDKLIYKPVTFQVPLAKDARVKLKNGITAYLVPDPQGQPLLDVRVLIKGGAFLNPPGKEGLARLMGEQLKAGGTDKTPADKLDERLEFLAADMNSFMGDTSGTLSLDIMEKYTREGFDLLMEVLTQPTFAQDRLDLAKKRFRQGFDRRNEEAASIEQYQLGYLLRGENHFTTRLPTAASLDAITREDLKALHAKLLHPKNLVVSVSGRFDRKAMTQLLNETLGSLKAAPGAEPSPKVPAPDFARKPGIYTSPKNVNQGRVTLVLPGLRRVDADWPAVTVMNHILGGGGFGSRLVNRIRSEEGLSYSVFSMFSPGDFYTGDFLAAFQTKNLSAAFGLRIALAEMKKMRETPVADGEIRLAKGNIIDGFPTRFDSKSSVAALFATEDYCGAPEDYWSTYRAKIQAVTPQDIQRVAQKYLTPEKLVISLVGNVKELEEGDVKDHPGRLSEVAPLPVVPLPLRDPLTLKPLK